MRSRNVAPGSAVMRTTISSDSTRVPPVTAERSPPDSRMTGADSPVMADSSTVAMPSTTSPSPGMTSPADTTHRSPTCSADDATSSTRPSARRTLAVVSLRVLRSVAACALPRPSAIASAKLANSTVNHRNTTTRPANTLSLRLDDPRSRTNRIVVRTDPTSTTNITGFLASQRGSSLRSASSAARWTMAPSNSERAPDGRRRDFGGRCRGTSGTRAGIGSGERVAVMGV